MPMIVVTVLVASSTVKAGNIDLVPVGDQAALLGGSVVAVVSDPGSAWYNPAGVSEISSSSINLSATAFVLRAGSIDDALGYKVGDGDTGLDSNFFTVLSLPSALVYARTLNDNTTLAAGIFSPQQEDFVFRQGRDERLSEATLDWDFSLTTEQSQYFAGIAVGHEPNSRLRLGMTVFGTYRRDQTLLQAWSDYQEEGPTDFDWLQIQTLRRQFGSLVVGGVQWEPVDRVALGLVVRSPELRLYDDLDSDVIVASADDAVVAQFDRTREDRSEVSVRVIRPPRLTLGGAYHFGTALVTLELDYTHDLDVAAENRQGRPVLNGRVGVLVTPTPNVRVGAGLFTDFAPLEDSEGIGSYTTDFYGGSLGLGLDTFPENRGFGFRSTLAVRYQLGFGSVNGVSYTSDQARFIESRRGDVVAHDVGLHVGSALHF